MKLSPIRPTSDVGGRTCRRLAVRIPALLTLAILAAAGSITTASAYTRPGLTENVALSDDDQWLDYDSTLGDITPDGRFVAFHSQASNVVPGRTLKRRLNVFVRDRLTGRTDWISRTASGDEPAGTSGSFRPSISNDGRYVVFESYAPDLVPADSNNVDDVFLKDRVTGDMTLLSSGTDGAPANRPSYFPKISGDGRVVVFSSDATNLVSGDTNGALDVFVLDRATGNIEIASVSSDEALANGGSGHDVYAGASVGDDGRFVAFSSAASNLVPGDDNAATDIFVRDRLNGTTEMVSVRPDGGEGKANSYYPTITADGRYVGFVSWAPDLVPGDFGGPRDVDYFLRDRVLARTERVSVASSGTEGDDRSPGAFGTSVGEGALVVETWHQPPAVTPDGRFVAFMSWDPRLTPGDVNNRSDVFVRDRQARTTERVTIAIDEAASSSNPSFMPVDITADGRLVAFTSQDRALVPGDINGDTMDVFVRNRGPHAGLTEMRLNTLEGWVRAFGSARLPAPVVSQVADNPADAGTAMRDLGAEIVSASVLQRPEEEDLLFHLDLASLPSASAGVNVAPSNMRNLGGVGTGAVTPLLYGFDFTVDGTAYQIRATLGGGSSEANLRPSFGLYRCTASCDEVARLRGGIGVAGADVDIALPMDAVELYPGLSLTSVRAFAAVGEARMGALQVADEIVIPDGRMVGTTLRLGVAPAAVGQGGVSFSREGFLLDGEFVEILDVSHLKTGDYRVWARVCVDVDCWTSSRPFEVGG